MKQNSSDTTRSARLRRLILAAAVIVLFLIAYKYYYSDQPANDPSGQTSFIIDPSDSSRPQESSSSGGSSQSSLTPQESSQAESIAESQAESAAVPEESVQPAESSAEPQSDSAPAEESRAAEPAVSEDGEYSSKEDVALYLHLYGHLPSNYITKDEAETAGWVSSKGNLWKVTDHKIIGGMRFGNYEGHLPTAKGRKYYECDVNYSGGYRGEERLVYSNDGLIYYTNDHYNTFTLLYDKEGPK